MEKCPGDDTLQRFGTGELDAAMLASVAEHVNSCSRCQARLGETLKKQEEILGHLRNREQAREAIDESDTRTAEAGSIASGHPRKNIGPYELLETLGEGGLGTVYLAQQHEPVRRRVALKVIKAGMDTKQVVARFEAERQALAVMDHPHVAKVFDGGATPEGRPYFVMELVAGEPITVYCDRNKLGMKERLELFIGICEAVQHAHQKGLIHRDLKPSNVLVTVKEGKPIPKVIDFGVAKAINQRLTEKTVFTEQGLLIGTPEYMSPEQAEMGATDVDTRSDVYSLGVLLYELLTGTLPFDSKTLRRAGYGEIQRIIRDVEPPKPSTRLSGLSGEISSGASHEGRVEDATPDKPSERMGSPVLRPNKKEDTSLAAVAARRRCDPKMLVKSIRGDLDWIVMKCLEKDRTRRYETANAIALEIRRNLNNEPVLAGPPSASYRIRKFVRRNRGGVVAAIIVAWALLLATCVSISFARSEARQRQEALREAGRADQEAAEAKRQAHAAEERRKETQQVADFQAKMLSEIDVEAMGRGIKDGFRDQVRAALARESVGEFPNRRLRTEVEVEDEMAGYEKRAGAAQGVDIARRVMDEYVLKRAAAALEKQFVSQPLVQAQIRDAIGTTYQALGRFEAAEPYLRSALELRRRELGNEHPDVATSLNTLAELLRASADYALAEPLYREGLALRRKLLGDDHPDVAACQNNLAVLLQSKGDYVAAEPLFREALALRRKRLGDEHPDVAGTLNNIALLLRDKGDYVSAEPLFREALALLRKQFGDEHPYVAISMNNLGELLRIKGDYAAAEPLHREALALRRKLLGDEHPSVAISLNNLALLLQAKGDYAEAELLSREALALRRKLLGDQHPQVANSMNLLAELLSKKGDYVAAEPLHREALALCRRLLGDEHPQVAMSLHCLAAMLYEKGDYAAAEPLSREALALRRKLLTNDHPDVATSLNNLATLLQAKGDYAAAEPLSREVVALRRKLLGDEHPSVANSLYNLATLLKAKGDFAAAEPLSREALAICEKKLPAGHMNSAVFRAGLGTLLLRIAADSTEDSAARGARLSEAETLLLDAWETFTAPTAPARFKQGNLDGLVQLYDAWHVAEPNKGYDKKATEWREKLAEWQSTTQPATTQPAARHPVDSRPASTQSAS